MVFAVKIGFHASHEQWRPSELLTHAQKAAQAGFDAAMCSDHFYPWLTEQGQSGFTWSWLGAALQATKLSFGTVNAPGDRYHPAIIAQAAATLAEMYPDRFWLAVGSGEALNEHITGAAWPAKDDRNARLKECVDVMRSLWAGETVNHHGLVEVVDAKLYTRPSRPPQIIGAAISEETAQWMAPWVDGLITVGKEASEVAKIIDAFRQSGGEGKPVMLQTVVSIADSYEVALQAAHHEWRQAAIDSHLLADLVTVQDFQAAAERVTLADVEKVVRVSAGGGAQCEWLKADQDIGLDAVYVHHVGRNVDQFIDVFASSVLSAQDWR